MGLFDPNCKEMVAKRRPIINMKTMKRYDSITEASKEIDLKNMERIRKNISRALNHNSIAYGVRWEYINL